jgi:hypothetical protein
VSASLHDRILDAADAIADEAERRYAEAIAAGRLEAAGRWAEALQHVAAAVRVLGPVLHEEVPR